MRRFLPVPNLDATNLYSPLIGLDTMIVPQLPSAANLTQAE
jgi:hypothetical protein